MTAFRVVKRRSVSYLDISIESQLHKPNRLWQPQGLTGDSPDARRTLACNAANYFLGVESRRQRIRSWK
jgi:hypothetical protein